jgi:DinB superfamily
MSDDLTPAEHAAAIEETRQHLIDFIGRCTDADWQATPIDGDPRSVGVITDHVANAYEYLGGWVQEIVAGGSPEVSGELVDDLNAEHAADAASITPAEATEHLRASGDALIALVGGLDQAQLALSEGQIARFAEIAARHARDHREQLEAALAG